MEIHGEPLIDTRGPGGKMHVVVHSSPEQEQARIASAVVATYRANPDPEVKHLVLVTRRRWGYELRDAIRRIDPTVPAQTVFSEDILETWPVREAFMFLGILGEPEDGATIRDWLSYREPDAEGKNWKATNRNAVAYANLRNQHGPLTLERLMELAELPIADFRGEGRGNIFNQIKIFATLYAGLPQSDSATLLLNYVLDSDLWLVGPHADQELAREDLTRLHAEAIDVLTGDPDNATLGDVVRHLRHRISTREPLGMEERPAIKIVTLWGAKGLTADYVYVVGLCDEALPGPLRGESSGLTDAEYEMEQQRLLYVSLTRAKAALVISRPSSISRGMVPALKLLPAAAGNRYRQTLSQVRFFTDVPRESLPSAISGNAWAGINLGVKQKDG
jgi:superfamily I DNA/RNA helicase